jgi:hypothetical protein
MVPQYRLTTFALAGGFVGLAFISTIYVQAPDSYGFSVAQYQRWGLTGIVGGVFAGIGVELAVRIYQRRNSQFSIREYLLAIALVATALITCGGMVRWANAPNEQPKPGSESVERTYERILQKAKDRAYKESLKQ